MKSLKSVSLITVLCFLTCVTFAKEEIPDGKAGTEPARGPMKSLKDYKVDITQPLMCYSSELDFCKWEANKFKLDIFDKLRTDEWQICSDESNHDNTMKAPPAAAICATNYPGNI